MTDVAISIGYALRWWLVLAAFGAAARAALDGRLPAGPALVHAAGRWVLVTGLAAALWAGAHAAPVFATMPIRVATVVAIGALALAAAVRRRREPEQSAVPGDASARFLRAEAWFALPFAAYLLMRGFNHDIYGLEKFMDFGFVNAALASAAMPPPDPWLAGATINYYYFGHVVTAFLIELTGVPPAFGFNLMLATLFGASFQIAAALAGEIASVLAPRGATIAAGVAGLWITMGGNLHGYVYGLLKPLAVRLGWIAAPAKPYWISDSTRFVGHDPPTADKLIHEFPAYAFYVGDLHAHVLALPGVLALLGVLLVWIRLARSGRDRAAHALAAVLGAGVGALAATNAWDAAIYGSVVAVSVVATGRFGAREHGLRAFACTLTAGLAGLALVLAPFMVRFVPFASGIDWVHSRTPAWQWALLYGAQLALAWVAVVGGRSARDRGTGAEWRFLLVLLLGGIACTLFAEVAYVRDIYGADWYRANTAFKFGFQGFVMLVLASSVGLAMLIDPVDGRRRPWRAVGAVELAVVPCLYLAWFVASSSLAVAPHRPWTLDGNRYLARETPEDFGAISWLRAHARPGDSIVEAVGESYTYAARISSNTGVPSVLGWPMHEWLWRGASTTRDLIAHEVEALYRDPKGTAAGAFLARARPRFVVVGRLERQRHGPVDVAGVESLGDVVWRQGQTSIVRLGSAPGTP